jgi:glutamate synthase (NADPH) small chain
VSTNSLAATEEGVDFALFGTDRAEDRRILSGNKAGICLLNGRKPVDTICWILNHSPQQDWSQEQKAGGASGSKDGIMNQESASSGRRSKRMLQSRAVVMRGKPLEERLRSFSEVSPGYSPNEAMTEASRCLKCNGSKAKCKVNCPVGIDIPGFVSQIAAGKFREAYQIISRDSMLPAVYGRLCPKATNCRLNCIMAEQGESISVASLERFVGDWHIALNETSKHNLIPQNAPKVAIIGGGPMGLACAADLARLKHKVTVFEALNEAGGILTYGIPEFRLPKIVLKREVDDIRRMGVDFRFDAPVRDLIGLKDILENQGYRAAVIADSKGLPLMMDIPGKSLQGVFSADEFISHINLTRNFQFPFISAASERVRKVVVAGGGNAAMDCARAALRMGASEVAVVYRRSLSELPAQHEEFEHAQQEGVRFLFLSTPVCLIGGTNNCLKSVECLETNLGKPDSSGRPRSILKVGSEFQLEADVFIAAVGEGLNPLASSIVSELAAACAGTIPADKQVLKTNIPGVFAWRKIIGCTTVISALADGRAAARAIHEYLGQRNADSIV